MTRKKYSMTLDKDLIDKIKSRCDPDIPFSRMVERYLKKGLETDKKKRRTNL